MIPLLVSLPSSTLMWKTLTNWVWTWSICAPQDSVNQLSESLGIFFRGANTSLRVSGKVTPSSIVQRTTSATKPTNSHAPDCFLPYSSTSVQMNLVNYRIQHQPVLWMWTTWQPCHTSHQHASVTQNELERQPERQLIWGCVSSNVDYSRWGEARQAVGHNNYSAPCSLCNWCYASLTTAFGQVYFWPHQSPLYGYNERCIIHTALAQQEKSPHWITTMIGWPLN